MVSAVRRGKPMRRVAAAFAVPLSTVQHWVNKARGRRLDRVNWLDGRSTRDNPAHRTAADVEDLVLDVRRELKDHGDLGEFGAEAVWAELVAREYPHPPSVRTIGRIFSRRGALDGRRRGRRPPPPRGWYLPQLVARRCELDSFDIVEGLVIKEGPRIEVLNGISLHGGLPASWPCTGVTAKLAVEMLIAHWREVGLPGYAQFDNDNIFQGAHQYKDTIGRVSRLCLSLGVIPVFTPPREPGFQAAIESYNARWQSKVWSRFQHSSLAALKQRSTRYVAAAPLRAAARIDDAPARRRFLRDWRLDLRAPPRGTIIFLRRTTERGNVSLLGRVWRVDTNWPHRLVRAEVALDDNLVSFYSLRRRDPQHQPLLRQTPYVFPQRPFQG